MYSRIDNFGGWGDLFDLCPWGALGRENLNLCPAGAYQGDGSATELDCRADAVQRAQDCFSSVGRGLRHPVDL